MTNCFKCFGLLGLVLCAAPPQAHAGALYGVQYYYSVVEAYTNCDDPSRDYFHGNSCGGRSTPSDSIFDNQLAVAHGDAISSATYQHGGLNTASASVVGTAQMGVLTIGGSASGTSLSDTYGDNERSSTSALAELYMQFFDTLTISGPGTTADFQIHKRFTAQIDHSTYGCQVSGTWETDGYITATGNIGTGGDTVSACDPASGGFDITSTVTLQTGKDYPLYAYLGLVVSARPSPGGPHASFPEFSHLSESASGTFSMYITPLTSGASFTAASGANYSETPEPATLIPFCSALLLLQTAIRKRQSR